jgi:hypothetical protein
MIALIISGTMKTDPAIPGIDALAIRPAGSQFAMKKLKLPDPDGTASQMTIGSVGFIKGRKRTLAARAIAAAMLECEYDCATKWVTMWESLRVIHCAIKGPFDKRNDFFRSMSISITSSITRTRPHIMCWVKIIVELGLDDTGGIALMDSFDQQARGGLTARLSKKERLAIDTVAFQVHEAARTRLRAKA